MESDSSFFLRTQPLLSSSPRVAPPPQPMPATPTPSTGESVLPKSASPPNHLIFLFHPAAMIVAEEEEEEEEEEEGDGKISGEKKTGKQARRMSWQTYIDEPLLRDIDGQRLTAAPSSATTTLPGHRPSPSPRSNLKNLLQ
ncbi:hypothetical protein VPH35_088552 [Triticum aestivum]